MSQNDSHEKYQNGELSPEPRLIVKTNGNMPGVATKFGEFSPKNVSKDDFKDTYGCGDSFAAGLTYGLAKFDDTAKALEVAIQAGADAAIRQGAFRNDYS